MPDSYQLSEPEIASRMSFNTGLIRVTMDQFHDKEFVEGVSQATEACKETSLESLRTLDALQEISSGCSLLSRTMLENKNTAYLDRLKAYFQNKQKGLLLGAVNTAQTDEVVKVAKRFYTAMIPLGYGLGLNERFRVSKGADPEAFLDTQRFQCDIEQVRAFLEKGFEVGGLIQSKKQDGNVSINFLQTATGSADSIAVPNYGFRASDLGFWHTHPDKDSLPVPSGNDLLTPYFYFSIQPNAILSKNGSRLYLPELFSAVLGDEAKGDIHPYEPEDRKKELVGQHNYPDKAVEYGNDICQGLSYISLS